MTAPSVQRGRIPRLPDDYTRAAAAQRLDYLNEATGTRPRYLGRNGIDPADVAGNIENFIGAAQVPVGVAGPLLIDGEYARGEFYVVLCGEISLGSAVVAEEWVDAHERFGRNRP